MARKKQEDKIVRVRFSESWVMMFGNSYKPWEMQLNEYLIFLKQKGEAPTIEDVHVSDSNWISWGGLKWCSEDNFQNQLNREGCQLADPDNPNPRQYKDMRFYEDSAVTIKVNKMLSSILAGIY